MGDSTATGGQELESLGGSSMELEITTVDGFKFRPLLDTPDLEGIEKELKGKKLEALTSTIASHPTSMKDTILEHSDRMLGRRNTISQKSEALEKLDSKTSDGESYIPGSLRRGNPIAVPGYLKGNERLEAIVQEGHEQNEEDKQEKAKLVRKMTQAVAEEVKCLCQDDILDALQAFSLLLVICYKKCALNVHNVGLNDMELALLGTQLFLKSKEAKELITSCWYFPDFSKMGTLYRKHIGMPAIPNNRLGDGGFAVATMVSRSLQVLMTAVTQELWDHHDTLDEIRQQRAECKKTKKMLADAKRNREMERRIAEQERETKEALGRGECPKTFNDLMVKTAEEAVKKAAKKQEEKKRLKGSGGAEIQTRTPTGNGQKTNGKSGRSNKKSNAHSSKKGTQQQNAQQNASRRPGRGRGRNSQTTTRNTNSTNRSTNRWRNDSDRPQRGGRGRGRGGRGGRGGRSSRNNGRKNANGRRN